LTDFIPGVLGFAVASRGFDHLRCAVFPSAAVYGKPPLFWHYDPAYCTEVVRDRDLNKSIADSAEVCYHFALLGRTKFSLDELSDVLTSITGYDFTEEKLAQCAERIFNIERAYLARLGIRRKDDVPHAT